MPLHSAAQIRLKICKFSQFFLTLRVCFASGCFENFTVKPLNPPWGIFAKYFTVQTTFSKIMCFSVLSAPISHFWLKIRLQRSGVHCACASYRGVRLPGGVSNLCILAGKKVSVFIQSFKLLCDDITMKEKMEWAKNCFKNLFYFRFNVTNTKLKINRSFAKYTNKKISIFLLGLFWSFLKNSGWFFVRNFSSFIEAYVILGMLTLILVNK